jgi:mannose-6-phosphate isomerase-like protein (cupin superfamily)
MASGREAMTVYPEAITECSIDWVFSEPSRCQGWRDIVIAMCNKLSMAMRDSASPAILRRSVMGSTADRIKDIGPQPQSFDIERATKENTNYRSVAWSGRYLQVTLMSIPAGGDIGLEAHPETDQFLRLDAGSGRVQMGAAKDKLTFEKEVSDGWCVLVPAGTWHNITNIGATPMQVYAIYAPAHHTPDKVQATAAAAEADKDDEPAAWSVQPKHAPDKHG